MRGCGAHLDGMAEAACGAAAHFVVLLGSQPVPVQFYMLSPVGCLQATRERLDTLTSLARIATEARAAQSERIEKLEHELKQLGIDSNIRMNDLELTVKSEWLVGLG